MKYFCTNPRKISLWIIGIKFFTNLDLVKKHIKNKKF